MVRVAANPAQMILRTPSKYLAKESVFYSLNSLPPDLLKFGRIRGPEKRAPAHLVSHRLENLVHRGVANSFS